jgi:hypothetical protein
MDVYYSRKSSPPVLRTCWRPYTSASAATPANSSTASPGAPGAHSSFPYLGPHLRPSGVQSA